MDCKSEQYDAFSRPVVVRPMTLDELIASDVRILERMGLAMRGHWEQGQMFDDAELVRR